MPKQGRESTAQPDRQAKEVCSFCTRIRSHSSILTTNDTMAELADTGQSTSLPRHRRVSLWNLLRRVWEGRREGSTPRVKLLASPGQRRASFQALKKVSNHSLVPALCQMRHPQPPLVQPPS
mmetsp:Transcript_18783/g.43646  ORF Transcript_18783/g.43646 Transcript_18783/m.43646 type:complete len:122 (-) Transcript_18783:1056-1421(-)